MTLLSPRPREEAAGSQAGEGGGRENLRRLPRRVQMEAGRKGRSPVGGAKPSCCAHVYVRLSGALSTGIPYFFVCLVCVWGFRFRGTSCLYNTVGRRGFFQQSLNRLDVFYVTHNWLGS